MDVHWSNFSFFYYFNEYPEMCDWIVSSDGFTHGILDKNKNKNKGIRIEEI